MSGPNERNQSWGARLFQICVVLLVVGGLTLYLVRDHARSLSLQLVLWVAVLAIVELLPVPAWKGLELTLSVPILLGVAILYEPAVAAGVVLVGAFDIKELRGERPLLTALFNRCQLSAAVFAGSHAFQAIAPSHDSVWYVLVGGSLAATVVFYSANVAFVVTYMRLVHGLPVRRVLSELRVGALSEFLLSYVGLGFLGIVLTKLFLLASWWSVFAFILPLIFARQMFFRTLALEEASKGLKDRERVLRALSNRMAEERQDERMQIAGYLHDDLAQMLFRLTLQIEMAGKRLERGDLEGVRRDLAGIGETKRQTSEAVRALIRDLHRSPIGRHGLTEAIRSFAEDMSRGATTQILADVTEVSLPPPIQLLIYQIVREATMNALKHADPQRVWISLAENANGVRVRIRDDGRGFDTDAAPPEGHFGTVMMKERALVVGGAFSLESEIGRGTTVTADFPSVWVQEGTLLESSEGGSATRESEERRLPPLGTTVGPRPPAVRPSPEQRTETKTPDPETKTPDPETKTPDPEQRPPRTVPA